MCSKGIKDGIKHQTQNSGSSGGGRGLEMERDTGHFNCVGDVFLTQDDRYIGVVMFILGLFVCFNQLIF